MGWLSETGRVVAVEADPVWIEADRSAACGKCAARAGCGQGAMSALLQNGKGRVRATSGETLTAAQCTLGDEVVIQVPEATLLSGTLLIYGFPLVTGIVLSILASTWGDLWSAAALAIGLLFGFAILRFATVRSGGVLPGLSEPRLSSKQVNQFEDLLVKS
jgi:sigma-E factor negative regulatory protein RseC